MTDDIKAAIADEAKRIVSGERRKAYGTPERNFDRIALFWSAYKNLVLERDLQRPLTPDEELAAVFTAKDVAAMMRLMKEARLIETPNHRDSYVDLVGYALCGAEIALDGEQS